MDFDPYDISFRQSDRCDFGGAGASADSAVVNCVDLSFITGAS